MMTANTTATKEPTTTLVVLAGALMSAAFISCWVLMSSTMLSKCRRSDCAGSGTIGTVLMSSVAPRLVLMVFSKITCDTVTSPGVFCCWAGVAACLVGATIS